MKIIRTRDYEEMSQETLEYFKELLRRKPDAVINSTIGASYDGFFELLVAAINSGEVDISQAIIQNLDEYIAPRDAKFTVHTFMTTQFYDIINQQPAEKHMLDGSLADVDAEIARYRDILSRQPRDLQILGLGVNAHLGANEPGTPFDQRIFLADSDPSTIASTKQYQNLSDAEAPSQMITLGMADILEAKSILVVASGERKAEAVRGMLEDPIGPDCPATALREHPDVTLIVDDAAYSKVQQAK